MRHWVHDFSEGSRDMRDLLGGKDANVAEMTRVLGADRRGYAFDRPCCPGGC
jgi:pyruvate,orthophosphate dikinase